MDWDEYFINIAYMTALKSKDLSTQVGAVIVGPNHEIRSTGYNGPCRGEDDSDPAFQLRPGKYMLVEHAERNSCYNATFCGVSTAGCTMYCTWGPPCADCARAVVQCGITTLVHHQEFPGPSSWAESVAAGQGLLTRLGVTVRSWSGRPVVPAILAGGVLHHFR